MTAKKPPPKRIWRIVDDTRRQVYGPEGWYDPCVELKPYWTFDTLEEAQAYLMAAHMTRPTAKIATYDLVETIPPPGQGEANA